MICLAKTNIKPKFFLINHLCNRIIMNEKWIIIIGAASANIEIEGNKSSQGLPFLHVTS